MASLGASAYDVPPPEGEKALCALPLFFVHETLLVIRQTPRDREPYA